MSSISDAMRQVFINTYALMELEKNYNYLNYGKYPYRERKNSVQIIADFNVNAYSVNGLFTIESEYTQVYPPEIIETIEQVLISATEIQTQAIGAFVTIESDSNGEDIDVLTVESAMVTAAMAEKYNTVVTLEYVEIESVTIQVLSYVFPFDCAPDGFGRLLLSF